MAWCDAQVLTHVLTHRQGLHAHHTPMPERTYDKPANSPKVLGIVPDRWSRFSDKSSQLTTVATVTREGAAVPTPQAATRHHTAAAPRHNQNFQQCDCIESLPMHSLSTITGSALAVRGAPHNT